jgi:hypothetical protein
MDTMLRGWLLTVGIAAVFGATPVSAIEGQSCETMAMDINTMVSDFATISSISQDWAGVSNQISDELLQPHSEEEVLALQAARGYSEGQCVYYDEMAQSIGAAAAQMMIAYSAACT